MNQTATLPNRQAHFQQLIGRFHDELRRYALWLTHDATVADDLVQETLLRAWKAMDRLKNPGAVKSWLITIQRRENARRFERWQPQPSAMPVDAVSDPHKAYDTSTEAFVVRRALEQLDPAYREPLVLQVLHGYSQKEIAAHLGISTAGAGTRLFRARQKLRQALEDKPVQAKSALNRNIL